MGTLNLKKMGLNNSKLQGCLSCCEETPAAANKALVDCIIEEESQTKVPVAFDFRYIDTQIPYGVDNYNVKIQKLIINDGTLKYLAGKKKKLQILDAARF